jgi:hypothetical protein
VFGFRALLVCIITAGSCLLFEYATQKLLKRPITVTDYSAIVTGLLLGMNLPATAPAWLAIAGSAFAIVVVKQVFGGIGQNVFNTALAARVFLTLAWPAQMTAYTSPLDRLLFSSADAITAATPLAALKHGEIPGASIIDLFIGTRGGTIGEVNWHTYADELNGINDLYGGYEEPLKKIYIIKIAPGTLEKCLTGIADPAVHQDAFNKLMASAVIHEIGHGLGIRHHSPVGSDETEESILDGVFDCAMRYTVEAEYKHPELLKNQNRYCHAGETWKKSVDGAFKEFPSHNCFGQIDVKSDP